MAPTRWFGLLSTDTVDVDLDMPSMCSTEDPTEGGYSHARPNVMQVSTIAPSTAYEEAQERALWQASGDLQLRGLEYDMYSHFVTNVSPWIDAFDPLQHFGSVVPRLALRNEGLMKAMLALGAMHLAAKAAEGTCEVTVFKHAAVQYYSETLQYLQSAMRYSSYKNSAELLATTLIISTYEMIDGSEKGWGRHLKGVFWIQRTREINGESGGLEQAVWWAWIYQDLWAAFHERRRCYSFFKPTRPYLAMDSWSIASRIIYILAQCVNFCSDEEKRMAERDPSSRNARADELSKMLGEWDENKGIGFAPLPIAETPKNVFRPLWIHPPAFAVAVQLYHVARILLLFHRPGSEEQETSGQRDQETLESIDAIAGLAMQATSSPTRPLCLQCLFAAGLFCSEDIRRQGISDLIDETAADCVWPSSIELQNGLSAQWSKWSATQQQPQQ